MYTPGQTSFTKPEDVLTFVQQELRRVSLAMQSMATQQIIFAELHGEPEKPREGMVVYADGTDWNPGDGKGIYAYTDGEWVRMSNLPTTGMPTIIPVTQLHEMLDVGWKMIPSGGTADQPALLTYLKDDQRVEAALTWGTSGGEAGNVTQAIYSWSTDAGVSYDPLGTETITYDSDSNVVAVTWS